MATLSTCESEYVAMCAGAHQGMHLKNLLVQVNVLKEEGQVYLLGDNQAALAISRNPVHHGRTKHLDIK